MRSYLPTGLAALATLSGCSLPSPDVVADTDPTPVAPTKRTVTIRKKAASKDWPLTVDSAQLTCIGGVTQPKLYLTGVSPKTGESKTYALNINALTKTTPYAFEGDLIPAGNTERGKDQMTVLFTAALNACPVP